MSTGKLTDLVEAYESACGVSDAELARRVGMSRQALHLWKSVGRKGLPDPNNLRSFAAIAGIPYRTALDAALADTGYIADDERTADVLTAADVIDLVSVVTGVLQRQLTNLERSRLRAACTGTGISLSGVAKILAGQQGETGAPTA